MNFKVQLWSRYLVHLFKLRMVELFKLFFMHYGYFRYTTNNSISIFNMLLMTVLIENVSMIKFCTLWTDGVFENVLCNNDGLCWRIYIYLCNIITYTNLHSSIWYFSNRCCSLFCRNAQTIWFLFFFCCLSPPPVLLAPFPRWSP